MNSVSFLSQFISHSYQKGSSKLLPGRGRPTKGLKADIVGMLGMLLWVRIKYADFIMLKHIKYVLLLIEIF